MSRSRNLRRRPTFWAFRPHDRYLFLTVVSLTFSHSATSSGVSSRLLPPCVNPGPIERDLSRHASSGGSEVLSSGL